MSRSKLAKAKAKRASKARAAQAAKNQAIEMKALATAEKPKSRVRRMFSLKGVREGLLTFGAVAGVICMLLAVASFAFDLRPVIFRSGSMAPSIDTGALAISRTVKAADLKVGDIVTVKTGTGIRVTHRIQNLALSGNHASLILKGDANNVVDDHSYEISSADRVLFAVPKAGYVVSWLSGPVGIFAGGLLAGLLVLTAFGPGTRNQRGPRARRLFGISVATLTLGVVSGGIAGASNTQAYYSDAPSVLTSGTFTAGNYAALPAAPLITGCSGSGNGLTITWSISPDPVSYIFKYVNPSRTGEPFTLGIGAPKTKTTTTNVNNSPGDIYLVAVNSAGTSPDSVHYHFSGTGTPKTCTALP